jgi:hypothetical protein
MSRDIPWIDLVIDRQAFKTVQGDKLERGLKMSKKGRVGNKRA